MKKCTPKPGDVIISAALLVLSALLALFLFCRSGGREEPVLAVTVNGTTEEYPLDADRELTVHSENGYTMHIVIDNGEASAYSCDCPDGICVGMGKISQKGETVVCVPAGILLKITGGGRAHVDSVAG